MKKILHEDIIEDELIALHPFLLIPSLMKKLESNSLKTSDQKDILNQVYEIIKDTRYKKVLDDSLKKNPDIDSFFSNTNSMKNKLNRTYCPLTSCDVERSFSIYKNLLSERRQRLLPQNIRDMMIIKYNNSL